MNNERTAVSYQEIDFDNGFRILIEHEYCKNSYLNQIRIKREYIDPEGNPNREEYNDIRFNLNPEQFKMFCEFFKNINGEV